MPSSLPHICRVDHRDVHGICMHRLARWEHEWRRDVLGPLPPSYRARLKFIATLDLATIIRPVPSESASGVFLTHSLRTVSERRGVGGSDDSDDSLAEDRHGDVTDSAELHGAPCVHNFGSTWLHPLGGTAGVIRFQAYPLFGFAGQNFSGGFRVTFPARAVSATACRCQRPRVCIS
jgi:hypothetical protein